MKIVSRKDGCPVRNSIIYSSRVPDQFRDFEVHSFFGQPLRSYRIQRLLLPHIHAFTLHTSHFALRTPIPDLTACPSIRPIHSWPNQPTNKNHYTSGCKSCQLMPNQKARQGNVRSGQVMTGW